MFKRGECSLGCMWACCLAVVVIRHAIYLANELDAMRRVAIAHECIGNTFNGAQSRLQHHGTGRQCVRQIVWQRATQLPDINDAPEWADQGLTLDAVVGIGHTEGNDPSIGAAGGVKDHFIIGRRDRNVAGTGRLPNAHLCAAIRIHVAMPVEMIGCKVEPRRCLGAKIVGVVQAKTRTLNGIHIVLVI